MNCQICGGTLGEPIKGPWKVRPCNTCGHKFGEVANKFQFIDKEGGYFDNTDYVAFRAANRAWFEKYAGRRFSDLKKLNVLKSGGHILEIGCSTGELLSVMKNDGFEVTGHDEAVQAVKYAREKYDVDAVSELSDFAGKEFDAVCAFHVIEHVENPIEFVNAITGQLKQGGILYLRMPHINSLASNLFGRNWPGLSIEHVQFFGRGSVESLLQATGFELVHFATQSHARFFAGGARRLVNGGSKPQGEANAGGNSMPSGNELGLMDKLAIPYSPIAAVEKLLDRGDELIVVARKRADA